jgi:hypothetical protein
MNEEAVKLVELKLNQYLSDKKFTGQIAFIFNCRCGGIGRISLEVKQDFTTGKDKENKKDG